MKLFFVLQRSFSVFGHAIAYLLRENYGVQEFCGYTYLRSAEKFLRSQKEIDYNPLLVDEDLYLAAKKEKLDIDYIKELEKEYGLPNLWPYIFTDSHFMMSSPKLMYSDIPICSHEQMLKHLQIRFKAIRKMLESERPDAIIFVNVGAMANNVLYHTARKMGIKTLLLDDGRVGKRVVITDNCYNQFPEIYKKFNSIKSGVYQSAFKEEARLFLENFRNNPCPRVLNPQRKINFAAGFIRWTRFFSKYLYTYLREKRWQDYLVESPASYFRNRILRRLNKWRGYRDLFENSGDNEDFAFFPLHYEPEITTLLLAPFYANQLAVIQNIAKSLPLHFKLYVKEHPAMLYRRPRSYYRALKKIPNVRLIDAKEKAVSLIQKAKLVLTITGTAGWEAVMLKKPVIVFGSVFYDKLSSVKKVVEIEKLPFLVKEALENYERNEQELIDFLSALFEESFSFESVDYEYIWYELRFEEIIKEPSFEKFVDYLAQELKLAKKDKTEGGADQNIANITDDHSH